MRDTNDPGTLDLRMTTLIGYARVSTADQNLTLQVDALHAAGCHRVFTDVVSGAKGSRPGLDEVLAYLRHGDTLVVWKLERLGRSLPHLVHTVETLRERGIAFRSLHDAGIDTTTRNGKLLFNLFATLAEFERDLIRDRTLAGLTSAAARGRYGGRKPVITAAKRDKARKLLAKGLTVREAAAALQVSKTALSMTPCAPRMRLTASQPPCPWRPRGIPSVACVLASDFFISNQLMQRAKSYKNRHARLGSRAVAYMQPISEPAMRSPLGRHANSLGARGAPSKRCDSERRSSAMDVWQRRGRER